MLLAKRTKPPFQWSFPGGAIEPGESAKQAAIREAREEVSVEIAIVGHAGAREVSLPGKRYIISVFAARLVAGEAKAGAEAAAVGWFDVPEIATLDTTPELEVYAEQAKRLFLAAKA